LTFYTLINYIDAKLIHCIYLQQTDENDFLDRVYNHDESWYEWLNHIILLFCFHFMIEI